MRIIEYENKYQDKLEIFYQIMFNFMKFDWLPESKDSDLRNINKEYIENNGNFWILINNNKIIGTIALKYFNNKIAELKRFYILPNYQSQGYGKKLLEKLLSYSKKIGYRYLRLDTTKKSKEAINLFKNYEFYNINNYNNDPYAEIFMEKKL